jgi:hypothetical protein
MRHAAARSSRKRKRHRRPGLPRPALPRRKPLPERDWQNDPGEPPDEAFPLSLWQ